ncbi:hypothetical protein B0H12DRAFT_1169478 [Mycena haematopus]|nr:hypothetical protein B0H12DRAFT_1169478 [Mycena haematopus]
MAPARPTSPSTPLSTPDQWSPCSSSRWIRLELSRLLPGVRSPSSCLSTDEYHCQSSVRNSGPTSTKTTRSSRTLPDSHNPTRREYGFGRGRGKRGSAGSGVRIEAPKVSEWCFFLSGHIGLSLFALAVLVSPSFILPTRLLRRRRQHIEASSGLRRGEAHYTVHSSSLADLAPHIHHQSYISRQLGNPNSGHALHLSRSLCT